MIWKTVRLRHKQFTVRLGDKRHHRHLITTVYFLFIPIYRSEKLLEVP